MKKVEFSDFVEILKQKRDNKMKKNFSISEAGEGGRFVIIETFVPEGVLRDDDKVLAVQTNKGGLEMDLQTAKMLIKVFESWRKHINDNQFALRGGVYK